jgi:hypothetical protein
MLGASCFASMLLAGNSRGCGARFSVCARGATREWCLAIRVRRPRWLLGDCAGLLGPPCGKEFVECNCEGPRLAVQGLAARQHSLAALSKQIFVATPHFPHQQLVPGVGMDSRHQQLGRANGICSACIF